MQTLNAGSGEGRLAKFNPDKFGLLIVDESHHGVADSYPLYVIDHFPEEPHAESSESRQRQTAPGGEFGQVFQSVAYDYEILDAITDGFLVPIQQQMVHVYSLDLSSVRTTAGDLNGADLAQVLEYEENLLRIAHPTLELTGSGRTVLFAASVVQAGRLAEILNRYKADSARLITGKTPKDERRQLLAAYNSGEFQYLCNVGVATEGFDSPAIQYVVIARPTKSRSLYNQMAGRGMRTLGTIDHLSEKEESAQPRQLIERSAKPTCTIIDFVGNSGKHKLMSSADILGAGTYDENIIERATRKAKESGQSVNMVEALEEATAERHAEREADKQHKRRSEPT